MAASTIETGTEDLLATLDKGVLRLTLNRPESRNATSQAMMAGLETVLARAELDPDVRCVALTGAGKSFCAGGDVKGMSTKPAVVDIDASIHRQRIAQRAISQRLHEMPKPTIAAINGAAAGVGMAIALSCDMRLMSESAIFMTAFARMAYSGDFGGAYFLTQLVGSSKARELYFLSDRIDAQQALALGLANWTCPPEAFDTELDAVCARLAAGPAVAYRYIKENMNRAIGGDLGDCLDVEATHHVHCGQTQDHREAVQAFIEKRVPVFQGR